MLDIDDVVHITRRTFTCYQLLYHSIKVLTLNVEGRV